MLGGIKITYVDTHFLDVRQLPDVSYKVSTSSRSLTQISLLAGLKHLRSERGLPVFEQIWPILPILGHFRGQI